MYTKTTFTTNNEKNVSLWQQSASNYGSMYKQVDG